MILEFINVDKVLVLKGTKKVLTSLRRVANGYLGRNGGKQMLYTIRYFQNLIKVKFRQMVRSLIM